MDTPYGENDPYHISTGHLPSSERLQSLVDEAYRRFRSNNDGKNSQGAHLLRPRRSDGSSHQAMLADVRARNLAAIGATLADGGAAIAKREA